MSKKRNTRSRRAARAAAAADEIMPARWPTPAPAPDLVDPHTGRAPLPGEVWVCWDWWDSRVVGYLVTRRDNLDDIWAFVRAEGVTAREEPDRELYEVAMNVASNPDLAARLPEAMDLREHGRTAEGPAVPPFIYSLWCHRENGYALQHHPGQRPDPYDARRERDMLKRLFAECFDHKTLASHPVRGLHVEDTNGGGERHALYSVQFDGTPRPQAA